MRMSSQNLRFPSEKSLEHRSLSELKGLWKVVHHGNLITATSPENTPRLSIYFRKLTKQIRPVTSADFESQGPAVDISVPAAELMRLPLNAVVENSRLARDPCIPLPSEEIDTLNVDISKSRVKFISRYARTHETDDFIIPYNEGRSPAPDSSGSKAYYVAIEYNGDPFGIIIPCAEVFRFFYCTSSRMLYTILSDKILDPDRYIFNLSRSGTTKDDPSVATIWLRQWMLNSDRRHIARLFFTEDKSGFTEAKRIFLRASGYADEGAFKHALIALPPFHGEMNLKCIFKKFVSDGCERIFVTRLTSVTNWTLPFKAIHFGRDNDGRRVTSGRERELLPDDTRQQRTKVLAEGAEIGVLENAPADDSINPVELGDFEFESRFPELEQINSPQVEKHEQQTKNNKGKKQLQLADGTLLEGSSSEHEGLVNVILRAMEQAAEIKREEKQKEANHSRPLEELVIPGNTKLHEMIEHLELAKIDKTFKDRLEIEYLTVLDHLGLVNGVPVNVLPEFIDGKSSRWFYIDKDKSISRPLLIVRLTLDGKIRYVIEFMHKQVSSDTSSLLLWHPDEVKLPDHLLDYAVRTCMRNRSVSLRNGELLKYCCSIAIKHSFSGDKKKSRPAQLIKKIFEAENKINKWICC